MPSPASKTFTEDWDSKRSPHFPSGPRNLAWSPTADFETASGMYPVSGSNRESAWVTLWHQYAEGQRCSGIYLMSFSARKLVERPRLECCDMVISGAYGSSSNPRKGVDLHSVDV